jgi:deoxyribose-phosphate aldolase
MLGSKDAEKLLPLEISESDLAGKFDHTNLQPDATPANIELLCKEAKEHGFFAVCINPCYVRLAHEVLAGTPVKVCTVVGFPLGANSRSTKLFEAEVALGDKADEIDMVMNIGLFKSGRVKEVTEEIAAVVSKVKSAGPEKIAKVIIESALLTANEIEVACKIVVDSGADFIKTSTGFSRAGGATIEALNIINRHRGKLKVKAAGGIRDLNTALSMLRAGADRLGASSSVSILRELRERTRQGAWSS